LRGGGTKESMKAAAESPAAFHLFLLFHKRHALLHCAGEDITTSCACVL
jgi:hypothetical protein